MPGAVNGLIKRAHDIFGDQHLALLWLNQPNSLCGGTSPMVAIGSAGGRRQVERQLAWFGGHRPPAASRYSSEDVSLHDLMGDPLIQLVLDRAGSGPEELLQLYKQADTNQRAA